MSSKLDPDDQRDIEKSDALIVAAEDRSIPRVQCACVHHDAYECARIRDRRDYDFGLGDNQPDRRACECCCHEKDQDELEDEPW